MTLFNKGLFQAEHRMRDNARISNWQASEQRIVVYRNAVL
jgi:hypothetical protein